MIRPAPPTALQQMLATATHALQRGDLATAELALLPLLGGQVPASPDLWNIAGTLRMHQGRLAEAASLFHRAATGAPREAVYAFNLGMTLARLGRNLEAESALRNAVQLKRDLVPAIFELGALLHRMGKLDEAESSIRKVLRLSPALPHADLALAAILVDAGRPAEAEAACRRGLYAAGEARIRAQLYLQLAQALRRQRKDEEALAALDSAATIDPALPGLLRHRAETMQNLGRFEEAVAIFEQEIARTPSDPLLHHDYNALLYQLGRGDEFLKSYDRAPQSPDLVLGKAALLTRCRRHQEAHALYAAELARHPDNRAAAIGTAQSLTGMGQYAQAVAAFDTVLARHRDDPSLFGIAAEPALMASDPQKAAFLCEQGLAIDPHNGSCLAMLGIASRMLGDRRDEALNGYDTLVRSFDLEPPDGYADMASFNAELQQCLDRLHPAGRELIDQSLRGGTQTQGHLFPTGLPLVEKLRQRIDEAVARYIAELDGDPDHPFLSQRGTGFRYSGSWSSRLRDQGFHVNHIHPDGWISSCYYVALPDAVMDETAKQGWIKFGEPPFAAALKQPIRRTIQPVPGRLVLFPSYVWHGTVPFHGPSMRTTIAFDVVPLS